MLQFAALPAGAQLRGLGSGQNGILGGLGGGLPSVTPAAPANIAGVLQYCIQSNYLSKSVAGAAEDALLGKVPGAAQSGDFKAGSSGLLQTGNGKSFNLSSAGNDLKTQMTHQVCDMVLQQAKTLL